MQQQQQSPAVLVACSTESNITAWDLGTGTQLSQYKTNSSGRLCALGHDYFVAAQNAKDSVHFWTWHKDQVLQRSFTQESLTAVAASPNGAYLAAGGNSGTIYVWDTASGALLRSWPAHYKAVSCLVFSDTGGVLVSCGDDTLVCAWLLAEVLDLQRDNPAAAAAAAMTTARVEPLHTWSDHTLPVTCLHLGMGEGSAVLVTASLDRSVKLWALATGQLLRSLTLPAGVTSVTLDAGEHVLLAGCADGSIYEVSLVGTQQQQQLQGVTRGPAAAAGAAGSSAGAGVVGGPGSCCYEGHTKAVSCLVVTPDGEQLVSGCEDGTVRVWDLRSRQCLRVIQAPNKAPVSGVLLVGSAARLAGHAAGSSSSSSSSKAGPKRLQPLAQLAKFAGAASSAKPWEGPLQVLDAGSCGSAAPAAAAAAAAGVISLPPGLVLQPCQDPLALLGQAVSHVEVNQPVAGAPTSAASSEDPGEVARLQEQVVQLQQQLQESHRVAEQWQSLHAQLHQFCTEQVLATP